MSDHDAFADQIVQRSGAVVSDLKADEKIGKYIDASLAVPRPFVRKGPIRLLIIGQDPTVEKKETRERVTTVLTLNRKDSNLYRFIERIASGFGVSLEENVYATNACKNFFSERPKRITEANLIAASWPKWQGLLADELARFPDAIIVTLGKPILRVLIRQSFQQDLKHYWGHVEGWKNQGIREFSFVAEHGSSFGRRFFPFPHVTNTRTTELYRTYFDAYLSFVRSNTGKEEA